MRLSMCIGERDTWRRRLLYREIVERVRDAGPAAVTVLRGSEGHGTHTRVRSTRLVDELITGGSVNLDRVELVRYGWGER